MSRGTPKHLRSGPRTETSFLVCCDVASSHYKPCKHCKIIFCKKYFRGILKFDQRFFLIEFTHYLKQWWLSNDLPLKEWNVYDYQMTLNLKIGMFDYQLYHLKPYLTKKEENIDMVGSLSKIVKNSHYVLHCLCSISPQITNINIKNQFANILIGVSHSSLIRKG